MNILRKIKTLVLSAVAFFVIVGISDAQINSVYERNKRVSNLRVLDDIYFGYGGTVAIQGVQVKISTDNASNGYVLGICGSSITWIAQSGVSDHAALSNLGYAASGHTGFAIATCTDVVKSYGDATYAVKTATDSTAPDSAKLNGQPAGYYALSTATDVTKSYGDATYANKAAVQQSTSTLESNKMDKNATSNLNMAGYAIIGSSSIETGSSTEPGQFLLYESSAVGNTYTGWIASPTITASYLNRLPGAGPSATSLMQFNAISGGVSETSFLTTMISSGMFSVPFISTDNATGCVVQPSTESFTCPKQMTIYKVKVISPEVAGSGTIMISTSATVGGAATVVSSGTALVSAREIKSALPEWTTSKVLPEGTVMNFMLAGAAPVTTQKLRLEVFFSYRVYPAQ